ncbi:MAG: LamG-like jellyroll fold domain-containing protein [Patescibacteria group bacterium]
MIQNSKFKIQNSKSAFTLIELIVVVAISAVISVGGFFTIYKYQAAQNIKLALGEIVAVARNTQEMSVTQKNGKQWGIRFSNSVADGQLFRTWSGSSFASSSPNQTYKLRSGVNFGNPATGKDIDVIFSAISGEVSQNQIITLLAGSSGSTVGDVVVNTLGKVTTRREEGLVGYWHFDEGTSTLAYDNSGYGNNGTLYNTPTWQGSINCKAGGCLDFNGTNQYTRVSSNTTLDLAGVGTVAAWIKIPSSWSGSLYPNVVSKGANAGWDTDGWSLYAFGPASNAIGVGFRNGGTTLNVAFTNSLKDQWIHIVGVWNGSMVYIYQNGVLKNSTGQAINPPSTSSPVTIARDNGGQYFDGLIDEVRIYNRALTATEILQMYNDIK